MQVRLGPGAAARRPHFRLPAVANLLIISPGEARLTSQNFR
jgi:hypothetical protein